MSWSPSEEYKSVVEANRLDYAENAERYNKTTPCLVSSKTQAWLQKDLDEIIDLLHSEHERKIRVLDACGGTGNIALKMVARRADVTLCDVTPELIEIFKGKCQAEGFSVYDTKCAEIGEFLSAVAEPYDLIAFSSALHHIEDYESILALAAECLSAGGVIYTVFDPIVPSFFTKQIMTLDYLFFRVIKHPGDIPVVIKRKIAKLLRRPTASRNDHEIPGGGPIVDFEYHAREGIDDVRLAEEMEKAGMKIIWHERYTETRFAFFGALLKATGQRNSFKLLLMK